MNGGVILNLRLLPLAILKLDAQAVHTVVVVVPPGTDRSIIGGGVRRERVDQQSRYEFGRPR